MSETAQELLRAAQNVIDDAGSDWYNASYLRAISGIGLSDIDVLFIALASPQAITEMISHTVYPGAEIDSIKANIALLKASLAQADQKIERLRDALNWTAGALQTACYLHVPARASDRIFSPEGEVRTLDEIHDAAIATLEES